MQTCNQDILNLLAGKSSTKQFVYRQTKELFKEFKAVVSTVADELNANICKIDQEVVVEYYDRGDFEAEIRFSGDAIIFHMHTNVFTFEPSHMVWQNSYVKKEPLNAYFGLINMYNFLADSLKYSRPNDLGHLIGRLFVNREKHFFTEGNKQLSFLYRDLSNDVLDTNHMRVIIERAIINALDFDLTTPNFNDSRLVTVNQIQNVSNEMRIMTSKKLGFRFAHKSNNPQ